MKLQIQVICREDINRSDIWLKDSHYEEYHTINVAYLLIAN